MTDTSYHNYDYDDLEGNKHRQQYYYAEANSFDRPLNIECSRPYIEQQTRYYNQESLNLNSHLSFNSNPYYQDNNNNQLNPIFDTKSYESQQNYSYPMDLGFQAATNTPTEPSGGGPVPGPELLQEQLPIDNHASLYTTNFMQRCSGFPPCARTYNGATAKAQLKRHIDSHKKPYRCSHKNCTRHTSGFSRRHDLKKHHETHHNEKNAVRGKTSPAVASEVGRIKKGDIRRALKALWDAEKLLRAVLEEHESDDYEEDHNTGESEGEVEE